MVLSMHQVLTHIGIGPQAVRTVVIEDLVPNPERLGALLDETKDGIEETCASYNKLPPAERFRLSRIVVKRLVGLMYWDKDHH